MSDETYNGWSNRATWAMSLDLNNNEMTYHMCENAARYAAVGNEDYVDGFHVELAEALRGIASTLLLFMPETLPDFDPAQHESDDPRDPHGPDDFDEVNWQEIAEHYDLSEYV